MSNNFFVQKVWPTSGLRVTKRWIAAATLAIFCVQAPLPAVLPQAAIALGATAVGTLLTRSGNAPLRRMGDIGQFALPLTGFGTAYYHNDREGMMGLGKILLLNQGIVEAVKSITNLRRPDGGKRTFPSGHTAAAFTGAAFLAQRYGMVYGLPAYLAAGVVGYSRVHAKRHWPRDVVAGALLGIGLNLLFTKPFKGNKKNSRLERQKSIFQQLGFRKHRRGRYRRRHQVSPYYGNEGTGVQFTGQY